MERVDSTYVFEDLPVARAPATRIVDGELQDVDDWRAPVLPYKVPASLALPTEQHNGQPSEAPCIEDTVRQVERYIINGSSVVAAKQLVGITKKRWEEWKVYANAGKAPFSTFMRRVEMARAYVEATHTTTIHRGAVHPDPKVAIPAAKLALEQQFKRYAAPTKQTVEVNHRVSGSVDVRALTVVATLTPEQIAALVQGNRLTVRGWEGEPAAPIALPGDEDE